MMRGKIRWSVVIPLILAVYLVVMAALGWDSYKSGASSGLLYFGGIAVVAVCVVCLHFHLKKREASERRK